MKLLVAIAACLCLVSGVALAQSTPIESYIYGSPAASKPYPSTLYIPAVPSNAASSMLHIPVPDLVVTWPAINDLVLSGGPGANPTGLAEVDGDCVTGAGGVWTAAPCPSGTVGADPTATSSATAVNGTATTFMRSDAAPAIGSNAVTNALLAQASINTIKGNITGANEADLTVAQTKTMLGYTYGDLSGAPAIHNLLLSAGSGANPTGLVEVDGDCVVGAGGLWTAAACPGGSSGFPIVLGSTSIASGSTTTTLGGLTLTSPTINGGTVGASTPWTITSGSPTVYVGLDASSHMVTGSPSGATGANPTASIGASAINGTATTFMRSDAAPPIGSNAVTNALAAQMPAHTIKGNNTAAPANAADLTDAQAAAELPAFVGDSGSGGTKGSVPAPAAGDAAANKFLAAGGGWSVPSGGGNVSTSGSISTGALGIWASGTGLAGTVIPGSGVTTFLSTPSSANLATAITDETGSGLAVFGTTPTLTTPVINGGTMGASTAWTITSGTPTTFVGLDASIIW